MTEKIVDFPENQQSPAKQRLRKRSLFFHAKKFPLRGIMATLRLMEVTVLAFAQARETFGFSSRTVPCTPEETPRALLRRLAPGASVEHLAVAVDNEYTTFDTPLGGAAREMILIPPVSGG